ncbi:FAD/NAD(P)-binding protein, partial [Streptomyces sp. NPDC059956]
MPGGISLGVIGGGAAAVCLIDELARTAGAAGSLTVFEPSPHLWRGRAYQVDSEVLKANSTPDDLSVRAGDFKHFERWLAARDQGAGGRLDTQSGARFVPRAVYGEYLEQTARAALGTLRRRGWHVDIIGDGVTSARRVNGKVLLHTGRRRTHFVDYAVLC